MSLLLIKYFSNLGVFYLPHSGNRWWIGVTTTKNNLGVLCTVTAVFLFWSLLMNWKRRKEPDIKPRFYFDLLTIITSLYILKGEVAYSATSLACLAVGVATIFSLHWMQTHGKTLSVSMLMTPVMLVFLFGASVPFLGTAAFSGLTSLLGRDVTFTGRTTIWEQLAPMALQSPFLGHGYGGFWLGTSYAEVNEAHNGYLEIVLGLGFAGLLLVMALLTSCCREAYVGISRNVELAFLGFALVIMMALHNVTEASLLVETDLMWTSLILVKMVGRAEMSVVVESTAGQPSQSAEPAPDANEAPPTAKSQFAGNET
jgi:O-antigen ligase